MPTSLPLSCLIPLIVGSLIGLVGVFILWVKAFRTNIVWGLVAVFVPYAKLVFGVLHWAEAKTGLILYVLGAAICIGGIFTVPEVQQRLAELRNPAAAKHPAAKHPAATPAPDLNAQIQEHRQHLETLQAAFAQDGIELTKQYQVLDAQRKALKPGDTAAIAKFNEVAAAYSARTTRRKQMQAEIVANQKELDALLENRSRATATPSASTRKVVMYTTSHCPACKAAKQYLAQKGVPYQEIDVETSRDAVQAFQKLGGHGVPLILVGDKKLEGFSPQALDALL